MVVGDFRFIWKLLVKYHGVVDPTPPGSDLETKIRMRREAVSEFYQSFGSREELIVALDAVNLAWGDIRSNSEAFKSPTARARGSLAQIDDRSGGSRRVVESPYRFSDAESHVRGVAAYRGEHNRDVLARWLDASSDEIDQWSRDKVISADERR